MTRAYRPDIIDKERRALELRRAGITFDQIAQTLGYKNSDGAWRAVRRAMQRTLRESGAEEIRDQELDRLDRLQAAVWPRALQGDLPAVGAVVRIMERRSKMLGLDAPITAQVKVEHFDGDSIDAEVQRLIATLEQNMPAKKELETPIIDGEIVENEAANNMP